MLEQGHVIGREGERKVLGKLVVGGCQGTLDEHMGKTNGRIFLVPPTR